jgi:4a-hydroxytetrahydrobiopterin dehydratase
MSNLKDIKCEPCRGDSEPVSGEKLKEYLQILPKWNVAEQNGIKKLRRSFEFKNFTDALAFTNKVGAIAEAEDHHPEIITEWGRVIVTWWTHKINGLHMNDFIMAARTDELLKS